MRPFKTTLAGLGLATLTAIAPVMAQNPQADYATCNAWAQQAVQPYLNQANAQGIGSALVGAGLGAALGGAVGGGRGAGIGAASGAVGGARGGGGQAADAPAGVQNMYNSYFASCMQQRGAAYGAPAYGAPAYQQPYPAYGYRPY